MEDNEHSDRHQQFMRRFLDCERELVRYVMYFVPNANDARDIVQNTAVALWKKYDDFNVDEPFVAWACRFARLEARRFLQREHRWHRFLDDATLKILESHRAGLTDELDERRIHLRQCLRKLPVEQRAIVEGYYFLDQPVERLAESANRTPDAVYKMLQRIRRSLMDCVDRQMEVGNA